MPKSLRLTEKQTNKPNHYNQSVSCPFCTTGAWHNEKNDHFKTSECGTLFWIDNAYQVVPNVKLTLVIEHNTCTKQLGHYGVTHCRHYFDMLDYAYEGLKKDHETVIVYKNVGRLSSGSVPHAHTQVVATNKVEFRLPEWGFVGLEVYASDLLTMNVATEGICEEFEINILNHGAGWHDDVFKGLEGAINHIEATYGAGVSYNLLVDIEQKRMKIICRTKPYSTMQLYGVRLLPPQTALKSFAGDLQKEILRILCS